MILNCPFDDVAFLFSLRSSNTAKVVQLDIEVEIGESDYDYDYDYNQRIEL